jgi:hypothetical protein
MTKIILHPFRLTHGTILRDNYLSWYCLTTIDCLFYRLHSQVILQVLFVPWFRMFVIKVIDKPLILRSSFDDLANTNNKD